MVLSDVLLEHLHSDQIEDRNHIGWVILQLPVQRFIEFKNVAAINIKGVLLCFSNLFQECDVMWFLVHINILSILPAQILVIVRDNCESCQKVFKL